VTPRKKRMLKNAKLKRKIKRMKKGMEKSKVATAE
jgi:hypothetical protein